MAFASPSEICRLRKLTNDVMCNLGVVCDEIDALANAAVEQKPELHNEALVSLIEALNTIPLNTGALETALPKRIEA